VVGLESETLVTRNKNWLLHSFMPDEPILDRLNKLPGRRLKLIGQDLAPGSGMRVAIRTASCPPSAAIAPLTSVLSASTPRNSTTQTSFIRQA
jgi:hypothetical protein